MMQPQVQSIPMDNIIAGDNDRTKFNPDEIQELAGSIKEHGLIQPITVRPLADGCYEIVAGERRYRAVKSLGWDTIQGFIRPLSDREADAIMLLENLKRADLDPLDEAKAYQKRIDRYGLTVAEIAKEAQVSESRVRGRLALLDLREDIQHLVRSNNLPLSYAALMKGLDRNFQMIAIRYLNKAKRPNIDEFRAYCSQLLEEQNKQSLFDLSAYHVEQIAEQIKEPVYRVVKFRVFKFHFQISWLA